MMKADSGFQSFTTGMLAEYVSVLYWHTGFCLLVCVCFALFRILSLFSLVIDSIKGRIIVLPDS